ncbi:MAG: Fe-S biogenesis protein NfuA, partial [Gammaproteobacteria bacterium]
MKYITISKSAELYLLELLEKQDKDTIGIKVFVSEPGTPNAETCIAY